MSVKALQFVLSAAEQMKEQSDGCPRLVRSAMLAVDVVGQKHRLHFLGLIVMIEKLAQAAGEERYKLRDFSTGNATKSFPHPEQVSPALHGGGVDFRRRLHEERLQITCQLFQLIIDLHKPCCIFCGNLRKFFSRSLAIHPPRHHMPVREGNLDRRIAGNHAQAVTRQLQFRNHFRPQHAGDIRGGGHAAAGRDFFGHTTSANNLAALQHKGATAPPAPDKLPP